MSESDRAHVLQGTRAGFVSRMVAASIDVLLVFSLLFAGQAVFAAVRYAFADEDLTFPDLGTTANSTLFFVLLAVVLTIAWSGSGRTIGNSVVGLRVVRENGDGISWLRALVRAIVVLAFTVVSMGWILVSRKNAGIHDLVCRTTVVYDWRPRRSVANRRRDPAETRPIR